MQCRIVEGLEVFGELERAIYLDVLSEVTVFRIMESPTSVKGTRGGPFAMSAAFMPGLILLKAPASNGFGASWPCSLGIGTGDFGPMLSWSSAMGGGLGRRGELEGEAAMANMTSGL